MLWEARKNLPFFRLMKYNVSNKLEVVDFTGLFLANIGALLKISSLKLVYYITKNKEQEEILKWLSEKRVEVIQNNEER